MNQSFTKAERICSKKTVDKLFGGGNASMAAFPLRAVYRVEETADDNQSANDEESVERQPSNDETPPISILVSVPKRKFHRAVDRNRMKRQIREAYRRNKQPLSALVQQQNQRLFIAFVSIADQPSTSEQVTFSVRKILRRIGEKIQK